MTHAQRLLKLLLSDDAAHRAQGEELLVSAPDLIGAIFGTDGAAWQTLPGLRLCLSRSSALPEAQCQWGLDCAAKALPLLTRLAPETYHYGLAGLRDLVAGVPSDTPVAIAEFTHQLRTIAEEEELMSLLDEIGDILHAFLNYQTSWFSNAAFLEEHHPDDDIDELYDDVAHARQGIMLEWAPLAATLHRFHAAAQGPSARADAIRWQAARARRNLGPIR
ncbi:MAG: hypothetical protein ACI8RZ_000387 [Myxococcota bacterium]|jgi:hypothetical protein